MFSFARAMIATMRLKFASLYSNEFSELEHFFFEGEMYNYAEMSTFRFFFFSDKDRKNNNQDQREPIIIR